MNKRNRPNLDIDLTSLLDVIFVVLMVVMCHQALGTQAAQEEIEQLAAQRDAAVAENEVHETQLSAYEDANDLVAYVTLRADYETQDPKTRHIQFVRNNDAEYEDIELKPETEQAGYDRLYDNLTGFLQENENMPVLIVLNEEHILYRDHDEISKMLDNLGSKYSNLYRADR